MPYRKSPYNFKCFFNKDVRCGQFAPKIWKKKRILPKPCERCKYYLKRPQKLLREFSIGSTESFDHLRNAKEDPTKNNQKRGG